MTTFNNNDNDDDDDDDDYDCEHRHQLFEDWTRSSSEAAAENRFQIIIRS